MRQIAFLLQDAQDHTDGVVAVLVVQVPGHVGGTGLSEAVYRIHDLPLASAEAAVELLGGFVHVCRRGMCEKNFSQRPHV